MKSAAVPLERVETMGLAMIPDVGIELGRTTALIGTRGSGKSQLLTAIAWLLTAQPEPASRTGSTEIRVIGRLGGAGRDDVIARSRRKDDAMRVEPPDAALPGCSFLRAADRLVPRAPSQGGRIAARMLELLPRKTSDAAAAEALVNAVEGCCRDGVSGEVLLVEEPELLLTPQAQRYLYSLLRRFAEGGNQVLYSTWSPAFVDAAHHEEILRLDLHGDGDGVDVRRTEPGTLSDAERIRIQAEFDHERSEMFFADKVVLVEGQTERLSLPFVFAAMGHDVDAEGISIVEMGGKGNLPLAARLLVQLHIPFVVVFDGDQGAASAELDATIRRHAAGAPTIRLTPDFEGAAGIPSHEDKVLHAWRRFANARPEAIPEPLAEIVRRTVAL